jgi:hypothetical protein
MNSWEKEQTEQEAADQAEERRVAREDARWRIQEAERRHEAGDPVFSLLPPYLFADERSQRRVEEEARQERPLDDTYATWTDQNEQLFR